MDIRKSGLLEDREFYVHQPAQHECCGKFNSASNATWVSSRQGEPPDRDRRLYVAMAEGSAIVEVARRGIGGVVRSRSVLPDWLCSATAALAASQPFHGAVTCYF